MTVMYYLNNVKEGGSTAFLKAKTRTDEPVGYTLNILIETCYHEFHNKEFKVLHTTL